MLFYWIMPAATIKIDGWIHQIALDSTSQSAVKFRVDRNSQYLEAYLTEIGAEPGVHYKLE